MSFLNRIFGGKQTDLAGARKASGTKIPRPKVTENPAVQSVDLNRYIAERLNRERSLNLHSAFQLKFESFRIGRKAYRQPAWGHHLYTRQLYELFMLGLTARALKCSDQMAIVEKWFVQDTSLWQFDILHHFTMRLNQGDALFYDVNFLRLLAQMRRDKDKFPDELGPFHFQLFPYDFAPEEELLFPGSCPAFDRNVPLDSEVEAILVELVNFWE